MDPPSFLSPGLCLTRSALCASPDTARSTLHRLGERLLFRLCCPASLMCVSRKATWGSQVRCLSRTRAPSLHTLAQPLGPGSFPLAPSHGSLRLQVLRLSPASASLMAGPSHRSESNLAFTGPTGSISLTLQASARRRAVAFERCLKYGRLRLRPRLRSTDAASVRILCARLWADARVDPSPALPASPFELQPR